MGRKGYNPSAYFACPLSCVLSNSLEVFVWDLSHGGERVRTVDVSKLRPGRRARLFPVSNDVIHSSHLIVVDSDSPGSQAAVIDVTSGRLVTSFGDRDPAVQSASRLSGRIFCRQRTFYDAEVSGWLNVRFWAHRFVFLWPNGQNHLTLGLQHSLMTVMPTNPFTFRGR